LFSSFPFPVFRKKKYIGKKSTKLRQNIFFQKVVVPEKRAIDTTQDECTLMAKTKRCDEIPMKFADGKWLYVPEPSEEGSWLRTVPSQVLNCMVEEINLLHGIDDLIDTWDKPMSQSVCIPTTI
jgi:hypothetical protein